MVLVPVLPQSNEFEVQWDASQNRLATFSGKQVAAVVRISTVLDRDDVHVQTADRVAHGDRVPVAHLDLVALHLRVGVADALRQPFQKVALFVWDLVPLDIERDVDVVERLQRGALGQTPGLQRLDQPVLFMVGGITVQLLPQQADLVSSSTSSRPRLIFSAAKSDMSEWPTRASRNGDSTAITHLPVVVQGQVTTKYNS